MITERKLSVLVVDNDPLMGRTIKAILERRGLVVETVTNPLLALDACLAMRPDFVITEIIMMPMGGIELMRKIRENFKSSELLIIALTILDDGNDRMMAKKAGADAFLSKDDTTIEEVIEKIAVMSMNRALVKS